MASGDESRMQISREELMKEKVDIAYRDYCAHLLVPLNKCRRENLYSPWECQELRHGYEKCQYDEYQRRVKEMTAIRAEQSKKS